MKRVITDYWPMGLALRLSQGLMKQCFEI
jgi:hypothetical protein